MYVITCSDVENLARGYHGHIVMDEEIYPQILDEILLYDVIPLRTYWDWEDYTQEEYEEEFEMPLPPINSVVINEEVNDHLTKKLTKYFDSTTPQQRKDLGLVLENVNKQGRPFREWIRSSLDYYGGE
jgi:hypothetical protein